MCGAFFLAWIVHSMRMLAIWLLDFGRAAFRIKWNGERFVFGIRFIMLSSITLLKRMRAFGTKCMGWKQTVSHAYLQT